MEARILSTCFSDSLPSTECFTRHRSRPVSRKSRGNRRRRTKQSGCFDITASMEFLGYSMASIDSKLATLRRKAAKNELEVEHLTEFAALGDIRAAPVI